MRASFVLGLALIAFYGVCTVQANARPKKIDYHPGICQKMGVIGGGGASGANLSYSSMGAMASGGDISIVCPLQHVTLNEDLSAGPFNVTVTAKVLIWPGTTSTCDLRSENTGFVSIPLSLTGAGTISGNALSILPTQAPSSPFGMRFLCSTFRANTQLGSIQIQIDQ